MACANKHPFGSTPATAKRSNSQQTVRSFWGVGGVREMGSSATLLWEPNRWENVVIRVMRYSFTLNIKGGSSFIFLRLPL